MVTCNSDLSSSHSRAHSRPFQGVCIYNGSLLLHQVSKFNSLKVVVRNEIDGFQFRVFVDRNSAFLKYSFGTSLPLINTNTNYYSISNDITKQLSNPVYIKSVLVDISMYFCLLLPVSKNIYLIMAFE